MKLKSAIDLDLFRQAIQRCNGGILLKSSEGDVFNLKSTLSAYIALERLLEEQSGKLELYAVLREDIPLMREFIQED